MTVRLLANENFPRRLVVALRQAGHDVAWVREAHPGLPDVEILGVARAEARAVATFDKDFGSLAFAQGEPAPAGIILIRMNPRSPLLVPRVLAVLEHHQGWPEHLATIEPDRMRLRALPRR